MPYPWLQLGASIHETPFLLKTTIKHKEPHPCNERASKLWMLYSGLLPYIRPHTENEQTEECLKCTQNDQKHTNCKVKRPKIIIKRGTNTDEIQ